MTLVGIALLALALVGFATSREDSEGSIWPDVILFLLVLIGATSKRKSDDEDDDEDC